MQGLAIMSALLNAASAVTTLVGSGVNARIYPVELPQAAPLPAIVIECGEDNPHPPIDVATTYLLRTVDVTLHILAKLPTDLSAVQLACESAAQFQRGSIGGFTVHLVSASTVGSPEVDSGMGVWYLPVTFSITYRR